jgi:excisionase family DNA binding protein
MALPHLYLPAETADQEAEQAQLHELERLLGQSEAIPVRLIFAAGEELPLPPLVQQLLTAAVHALAEGEALSLVPLHQTLTVDQAAALLQVPVHYLERLLDRGHIPATGKGSERQIMYADLIAYQRERQLREEAGLREIARLSEDLGLYDE